MMHAQYGVDDGGGAIDRYERRGVGHLDQLGVGEGVDEPASGGDREGPVERAPDDAHRPGEPAQAGCHLDELVAIECASEAGDVVADAPVGEGRLDPAARQGAVARPAQQQPERQW